TTNYASNDYKLLTEVAARSNNYDYIHSIALEFTKIFEKNPTKKCKRPLEIIYDKLNCSLCRKVVVKILIDTGVLSKKIFNEMEFDCSEEIREMYRQMKAKAEL
ncbi:MAG: hypothetical protein LBE82_12085, partial [Chitinophagaceae bacterium]|nr:hypothetical protein [Chitinophagaceae bacterium]